ncbi:unnamed protein product [Urochloa humidicola]
MDGVAGIYDNFEKKLEDILQDPIEPPVSLPVEFLRAITDDFSSGYELGRGGFGVVYKGVLRSGKVIAVKKIYHGFQMDEDSWSDELNRVIGITHPNVVQLIGYCAENKMETVTERGRMIVAEMPSRFLCFEYLSNGCLQEYISS